MRAPYSPEQIARLTRKGGATYPNPTTCKSRRRVPGTAPAARVGSRRWRPTRPICRPTKGGASGASKIIGTDYWFAGPGRATRKPVGRGDPRTPSPEGGIA